MFIQEGDLKLSSNAFDAGSGVEYGQNLVQMPASGKIEYEQQAGAPLTLGSGAIAGNSKPTNPPKNRKLTRFPRVLGAEDSLKTGNASTVA